MLGYGLLAQCWVCHCTEPWRAKGAAIFREMARYLEMDLA